MNSQIYELMEQSIAETKRQLEALKRLERGEGSGALTGFAAAKRAAEPGGAEDLPQSLAVSAVEAQSATPSAESWESFIDRQAAAIERERLKLPWWHYRTRWCFAGAVVALRHALKLGPANSEEPESERPRKPPVVPQASPCRGFMEFTNNRSASGRRNAGVLAQPTNDSTDTKNGQ